MNKPLFLLFFLLSAVCTASAGRIAVVPKPVSLVEGSGVYTLRTPFEAVYPSGDSVLGRAARFGAARLGQKFGDRRIRAAEGSKGSLVFARAPMPAEGYRLTVGPKGIRIEANDYAGAVYGIETLLQLLPPKAYGNDYTAWLVGRYVKVPQVAVDDFPRFPYRGMHLDCSRHFYPIDSVKRYLDYMAMHKLNRFHWHLTDDEGWRIESKRFAELNTQAALRVDRRGAPWSGRKPLQQGEKPTYGGVYTQDDIRDLLAYAADRAIAIVPEVETPGHSSAVFAAFPELSCLGTPQAVPPGGYFPANQASCYCAGNDAVFDFLEEVLDEVAMLFPDAPYIHIGGDEVDKRFWKNCPKCKKRIADEGLKDFDELQSYFIGRVDQIVRERGKRIIGWDEILEGGLVPDATVMSWRGEQFGIEAARAGHDVVMSPNTYLYFDYYQNDPAFEPEASGSLLSLGRVYSYNPVPDDLDPAAAAHILGAQANLWSEYLPDWADVERMVLPRMSALAEVVWTPQGCRDWNDFAQRMEVRKERFDAVGANYHRNGSQVVGFDTRFDGKLFWATLSAEPYGAKIRYTTDGTAPSLDSPVYDEPIAVDEAVTIRAAIELPCGRLSPQVSERLMGRHKAIGATITYNTSPAEAYKGAKGAQTLVDGLTGALRHDDGTMQGFNNRNFDLTVDLGRVDTVRSVGVSFLQSAGSWIYLPSELVVSLSDDGTRWTEWGRVPSAVDPTAQPTVRRMPTVEAAPAAARYLRIEGINPPTPDGLPGAGTVNWIFADEIVVR